MVPSATASSVVASCAAASEDRIGVAASDDVDASELLLSDASIGVGMVTLVSHLVSSQGIAPVGVGAPGYAYQQCNNHSALAVWVWVLP